MSIRLLHGDCLEMMKDLSANSVDLIICDLPYGCLGDDRRSKSVKSNMTAITYGNCLWDIKINLEKFWAEAKRILKNDHCPVIHFCTTKFGNELINSNPDWFRYDLVWDKQRGVSFLSANKMPMRSHEMVYVFSKKGAYYNRVDISGNFKAYSFKETEETRPGNWEAKSRTPTQNDGSKRCVLSVIQNPNKTLRKSAHPTEKPSELYKWLIERYCPPGGTVLDPTFGSGNSCFTAHALGRHAIGIEKDKDFYDKAVARIEPPKNVIS